MQHSCTTTKGLTLMSRNESPIDRIIRLVIAVAAVVVAFLVGPSTVLGIILFVVAAVMLLTAAVGFCPIYRMLGISTSPSKP